MEKKDKNNSMRSDFLRYVDGKMSARERNAFERKLMQDGFSEEASEGFSELSGDQVNADLSKLDNRMHSRVSRRNTAVFYRIAASVAVLLVLSSVFIILNRRTPSEEIAQVIIEPVTLNISESEAFREAEMPADSAIQTEEIILTENITRPADQAPAGQTAMAALSDEIKIDLTDRSEKIIMAEEVQETPERALTLRNEPVPLAGQIAGLATKSTREVRELNESITNPDSTVYGLDEIVVVGYGAVRKAEDEFTGYASPMPVGGKSAFQNYISNNLRKPSSLTEGEKEVVIVSLMVSSTGIVDSVYVVRSPGKEFSDEAIRIIKAGPAWTPAENKGVKIDDEIRVRIIFR